MQEACAQDVSVKCVKLVLFIYLFILFLNSDVVVMVTVKMKVCVCVFCISSHVCLCNGKLSVQGVCEWSEGLFIVDVV